MLGTYTIPHIIIKEGESAAGACVQQTHALFLKTPICKSPTVGGGGCTDDNFLRSVIHVNLVLHQTFLPHTHTHSQTHSVCARKKHGEQTGNRRSASLQIRMGGKGRERDRFLPAAYHHCKPLLSSGPRKGEMRADVSCLNSLIASPPPLLLILHLLQESRGECPVTTSTSPVSPKTDPD